MQAKSIALRAGLDYPTLLALLPQVLERRHPRANYSVADGLADVTCALAMTLGPLVELAVHPWLSYRA